MPGWQNYVPCASTSTVAAHGGDRDLLDGLDSGRDMLLAEHRLLVGRRRQRQAPVDGGRTSAST
jgi:hypothetical protein